jgi:hypothetical protein
VLPALTQAQRKVLWHALYSIEQVRLVFGAALLPGLFTDVLAVPGLLRVQTIVRRNFIDTVECSDSEVSNKLYC